MDLRRLRVGEVIVAASGAALVISLFLPWYASAVALYWNRDGEAHGIGDSAAAGLTPSAPFEATSLSGFEALSVLDVVLALIGLAAVALLFVTAAQRVPAVPIAMESLLTLAGLVATILVLIRVIDVPDGASGREWGLWLALAGAIGIAIGALVSMRDERLSTPGRTTDLSGRPAPPQKLPDPIPAPRPE
jgi:hypothetical protein